MSKYYFYSRNDKSQEPIDSVRAFSRLQAAKHFAAKKRLPLKSFLSIWGVESRKDL